VLGLVLALAALLSGLGILLAPILANLVAPGFDAEQTALTTDLVRILFPMSGVMIVAAWCLGVLNSHRRFFLPYVAPVLWNGAQIAGLLLGARLGWGPLVHVLAWSTLAGSLLQLGIQLPSARRLAGSLRPALERSWEPVRRVARNAGPVAAGQGIFQVSSLLDVVLASTLTAAGATGAVSGLYFAQRIAYLPLGLFGVSVATASLPEMSREEGAAALRPHLVDGFFRILFFVLPSAVVFLLFGDLLVALIYQHGEFGPESALIVRWILSAYALGIVASSLVKLFASGFHALQNTVAPMRIAAVSVVTGVSIGAGLMFWLGSAGFGARAAAGLAAGGAVGAWLNLSLLWRGLTRITGPLLGPTERRGLLRLSAATVAAALISIPVRWWLGSWIAGPALFAVIATLFGTLLAGAVPYLLIARRPPTHVRTPAGR
jgi:putative peptidoglycan lipid II flippase